jgi:signal transduction histidine kinase
MRISTYIVLSFILILVFFTITTYINFRQSQQVKENSEFVSRSGDIIRNTGRFQRNILTMVSGLRGFLITGEKYFVESYDAALSENEAILNGLSRIIPDTSIQRKRLNEIIKLNNGWVDSFAEPLRQAKALSSFNDSNLNIYKELYRSKMVSGQERSLHTELQDRFRSFSNYEYEMRHIRKQELSDSVQRTRTLSFILTIVSVVLSLIIIAFLTFKISNRIGRMVALADEIARGNYTVRIDDRSNDELTKLSGSLNRMTDALAQNISLLKRKNEELDQFAHIVSHDLKGPLRGIDNVVTWIEEDHQGEMSAKVDDYLQLIKGRVLRAENLIEGILAYARIDKEAILKEQVDINELIKDVVDDISLEVPFDLSVASGLPSIFTERLPLFQVFSNLISNAIKYNDKPKAVVKIYHVERESCYEFFVEDNGPGIAASYHRKIFMIFQTLKDRDTFESTGVGLAIVKKILDSRNEKIGVVSSPGMGATFSFTWKKILHGKTNKYSPC